MLKKDQVNTREYLPKILLISGSGRNCGKTSLACEIIESISKRKAVIALKISPHFHQLSEQQQLLYDNNKFKIYRETDSTSGKDSSRMLKAGATDSIYLQCEDENLAEAWEKMNKFLPENRAVVCESGSLAKLFKPGLHLLVEGENPDRMKRSYLKNKELSDRIVHFDGYRFNLDISDILFTGNQWKLKEKQDDQIRRSA